MATNKNAQLRYKILDKCFRNTGRKYFINDLIDECSEALIHQNPDSNGVSRRQILNDIDFMESEAGWSINLLKLYSGKKKYYRYEDPSYSIFNAVLNDSEVEMVKSAISILSKYSGGPQFDWIHEIIPKIQSDFGLVHENEPIIELSSNEDLRGKQNITPLFNAIVNRRVLKVEYRHFKSRKAVDIVFHPHYLKQYNNRWFVFGMNPERKESPWNLALDRIESITETSFKYQPSNINWEDYFSDMIGVTKPFGATIEEVELEFCPEAAPYVLTKPLHLTQKFKYNDTYLNIRIQVVLNFELENLILSFGEQVRVIRPEQLRQKIYKKLAQAAEQYNT